MSTGKLTKTYIDKLPIPERDKVFYRDAELKRVLKGTYPLLDAALRLLLVGKEQLYQAISEALKTITLQNVHAYFKHCGLCVLHNQ
jgi:hypothetical protein